MLSELWASSYSSSSFLRKIARAKSGGKDKTATYEQIKGTPMGSQISGLIAELVLQELDKIAFTQQPPIFWRRYVDDAFLIVKRNILQNLQDLINSIFPDIQFMREEEKDRQLPFVQFS
ncbi:unnamed protein product [Dibothriocephalus latus]|uniref:Reverse transcriptase domain-containing protein n=1 Tax=Dibothriocephalus latus TaxID=60516 RepID=A0A3P7LPZ7_DIBLA|nr:unnamed protein product [Dibothriocephalus latus]